MWQPGRAEQARVAARVRELVGDRGSSAGSHRQPEPVVPARSRWEPSRAVVTSMALLVLLVVAATAWWYLTSRPPSVPVSATGSTSPAALQTAPTSRTTSSLPSSPVATSGGGAPSSIVVDVAGKVVHPGVYTLRAGARVDDAVRAAGGVLRGVSTTSLNLASPLHDGDQVVVGVPGGAGVGSGAGAGGGSTGTTSASVDLNTATEAQLDALPGVGPVLAQHILDWRSAHGAFTSVDQLNDVSGIGDAKFADLKSLVSV